MKWFRRRTPAPHAPEPAPLPDQESTVDLAMAMNIHREAQLQAESAHEVVNSLARSRIRNGFAPAIEQSIINRYLGGAT